MSFSIADIKVYAVNASALAAYITLPNVLEILRLANGFFHDTQFVWKALPAIAALFYTLIRIYEKLFKNSRDKSTPE